MSARVSGHVQKIERKRGAVYYVKYRLRDGREIRKKLGPAWDQRGRPQVGYFTKHTAEEALREILVAAQRGAFEIRSEQTATFADAATEYLRYVADVRQREASTVRDYRGVIEGYLLPAFGHQALNQITPDHIDAYKERLLEEGRLSRRTIVRHLNVLHGIFRRARRVFGLTINPASAELVDRPQLVYTGEFDTYSRSEIELLASAADSSQDAAIFRTAAFTGLRQGELLGLRWSDVDFVGGMLHVRRNFTDGMEKVPKGKKVRSVPMTRDVIEVLARLKDRVHFADDGDLVFASAVGDHLDSWALRRRFYAAIHRAGLRRIRFHDLRHCFGSAAITVLDGYAVQSYMGHQHYSTTQRYLHHKPRPADARALDEAFREVEVEAGASPIGGHYRADVRIPGSAQQAPSSNAPATTCSDLPGRRYNSPASRLNPGG